MEFIPTDNRLQVIHRFVGPLQVRQTLAQHPEHCRNADDLAHWLNLSARTLHRQLKEEGASLQQLKDAVRRDVAVAQLQRSSRPIKQIAALAGFNNEKSFIRAFKGWTGQTPDVFRVAALSRLEAATDSSSETAINPQTSL